MCRVLAYLGEPILLENLLYLPDLSFVRQMHQAALLQRLNLAGSGLLAWDASSERPELPYVYRSTQLAIYDRNLRALARKVKATALLAHLRGVVYDSQAIIGEQNLHPFCFERARLALAHNGQLTGFAEMKYALVPHIEPALLKQIHGTTDSEWIYALLLSQLDDPSADLGAVDIVSAVEATLRVLAGVRRDHGIAWFSPLNLFLSDGNDLVAACFTFDRDHYPPGGDDFHPPDDKALSIWFTTGSRYEEVDGEWTMSSAQGPARSCIVSSEPLTHDRAGWSMVPLQHVVYVKRGGAAGPTAEILPLRVE